MNNEAIKRLDAALAHFGLNDQSASLEAGLTKDALRNIRRGKSKSPRIDTLKALARRFGCSVEWLSGDRAARAPAWAIGEVSDAAPVSRSDGEPSFLKIEEIDIAASAGPGTHVDSEHVTGEWQFPREVVRMATHAPADRIKVIRVVGDSMMPTFNPNDRVMVDIDDTTPSPSGIFIVWDGLATVLKRVEHIPFSDPHRVRINSDNPKYMMYERVLDEAHIRGRVLGKWLWT